MGRRRKWWMVTAHFDLIDLVVIAIAMVAVVSLIFQMRAVVGR